MQGAHDRPAESPRELANSGLANIKHGLCHNLKSGDRRAAANALVYAASFLLRAAVWLRRTP